MCPQVRSARVLLVCSHRIKLPSSVGTKIIQMYDSVCQGCHTSRWEERLQTVRLPQARRRFFTLPFPLNFQHLHRGSCGLLSSVPLAVGAHVWHNKTVYRMGKRSATAISNIKRHLTDFSFCNGYLALGFSFISSSHFLRGLHLDSSICNVRPDTWIVDQSP